jgi:hypothetical protein
MPIQSKSTQKTQALITDLSQIGLKKDQFLMPKIYQKGNVLGTDYGPFLQKENSKYILYCHDIERGNIDVLKQNGQLKGIKVIYFGSAYYSLDAGQNIPKQDLNISLPLPKQTHTPNIYVKSKTAFEKAVHIAELALHTIDTTIQSMTTQTRLSEESIDQMIKKTVQKENAQCLHTIIHSNHLYPRCFNPNKYIDSNHPFIKLDIGVQYKANGTYGIADISRTFFMHERYVSNSAKKRYDDVKFLYKKTMAFVTTISKQISVGQTGNDIFKHASELFDHQLLPELLQKNIIQAPVSLKRNIGHWVDDCVEGTPFYVDTQRRINIGDIICIECPLGTRALDISINHEIQGIMTPTGFSRFH